MERRVLRGGSFNNNARNVRCANRNRNNPNNRNDNIGFRVVVSHIFTPPEMQPGHGWAAEVIKMARLLSWPRLGRMHLA